MNRHRPDKCYLRTRIPSHIADALQEEAEAQGVGVNTIVRRALRDYLEEGEDDPND